MSTDLLNNTVNIATSDTPTPVETGISPLLTYTDEPKLSNVKGDDPKTEVDKKSKGNTLYTYLLGFVVVCLLCGVLYNAYSKYCTNQDDECDDDADADDDDDGDPGKTSKKKGESNGFSVDDEVEKLTKTQQNNMSRLQSK